MAGQSLVRALPWGHRLVALQLLVVQAKRVEAVAVAVDFLVVVGPLFSLKVD
jgi:hypothetical protein